MAISSSSTYPAGKSYRRQALIWLMMTLLLAIVTALVWMFSQTPTIGAKIENAPIAAPQALITELEQPLAIEALHELDTEVQPIDFETTVRDLRNYPDEFKDKRYLLANKGKWTVQVMNVAENEVIVSYLEGRDDRKKFSYFRYLDDNNQPRYMLTYGLMSSPQEAVGAAKLIDFGLPANVRVLPEEISRYISIIDNYERPEPLKDLSAKRSRAVKLQPTKREVPVRQKAPTPAEDNSGNSADSNGDGSSSAGAENSSAESIRQSADTSETLSVNEDRTVLTENGAVVSSTDKPRKSETELKKPPIVATPKPPSSASNTSNNTNSSGTKNANTGSTKNNDSIKELIEDKNN